MARYACTVERLLVGDRNAMRDFVGLRPQPRSDLAVLLTLPGGPQCARLILHQCALSDICCSPISPWNPKMPFLFTCPAAATAPASRAYRALHSVHCAPLIPLCIACIG